MSHKKIGNVPPSPPGLGIDDMIKRTRPGKYITITPREKAPSSELRLVTPELKKKAWGKA